jgi:hypothetical protein
MPISTLCQTTLQTLPFTGIHPQAQCIYWDAALPAFGLRVYPSGRRSFVCAYREGGRKHLVRVGRADVLTLIEARERARSVLKAHTPRIAPVAPLPARGYWARVEAGQRIARIPLPPSPEHLPELLRIRGKKPAAVTVTSAAA